MKTLQERRRDAARRGLALKLAAIDAANKVYRTEKPTGRAAQRRLRQKDKAP